MSLRNGSGNVELTPKLLVSVIAAALVLGSAGAWGFGQIVAPAPARESVREEILVLAGSIENLTTVVEYNREEQEETARKVDDIDETLTQVRLEMAGIKARLEN